jgi:hypothetical protein
MGTPSCLLSLFGLIEEAIKALPAEEFDQENKEQMRASESTR